MELFSIILWNAESVALICHTIIWLTWKGKHISKQQYDQMSRRVLSSCTQVWMQPGLFAFLNLSEKKKYADRQVQGLIIRLEEASEMDSGGWTNNWFCCLFFFLVLSGSFDLLFPLDLCLMKKIIPLLIPSKISDIIFSWCSTVFEADIEDIFTVDKKRN